MDGLKIQIAIYKIRQTCHLFTDDCDRLDVLIKHVCSEGFKEQTTKKAILEDFDIRIAYAINLSTPGWKYYFGDLVTDNQDILRKDRSWAESCVVFLRNKASLNCYAVTGGIRGYSVVENFIDEEFGVDILSRLIKRDDRIIKSVREKSVVGSVLGATKYFRHEYNIYENSDFGKIYQELKVSLDKEVLVKNFGFSEKDLKKDVICLAKSSFRFNKNIAFAQIAGIIRGCEYVQKEREPIVINNVRKLAQGRYQELIDHLDETLNNQLWDRYRQEGDYEFIDFDLCHKDYEAYLTADQYIVKKNML